MKNKVIKLTIFCTMLTLLIGTTALAALPNKYGKSYTETEKRSICTMTAHGDSATAYTKATNNKSTGKYISAGVTKRYADSNATINSSNKAQVVSGGGSIKASIARSWKETNREYRHIVESWNCSYQPSGSGWDQYHVDVVSYTIKQSK